MKQSKKQSTLGNQISNTAYDALRKHFIRDVKLLCGQDCWATVAGRGTGSMFTLAVGDKIRLLTPMRNPNLSKIQKWNGKEFSVFVQFAAWRLESNHEVLCSSTTENSHDGPMVIGLKRLIGTKILSIKVMNFAFDLNIEFEGGFCLRVFCNQAEEEDSNNYSIGIRDVIYTVGSWSRLGVEPRPSYLMDREEEKAARQKYA